MKVGFKLLDVALEIEMTPEEVLAVASVFTPVSLATAIVKAVKEKATQTEA